MKKDVSRMCFICRNVLPKQNMLRVVKNSESKIFIDKTGKANGRGAYICLSDMCIERISNQKILNRAFKCEFPEEVYKKLCEELIDTTKQFR